MNSLKNIFGLAVEAVCATLTLTRCAGNLEAESSRPDLDFIGADGLARTTTFASSSLPFVL